MRKIKINIIDGEDGYLVVQASELPGCVSQGKTISEALANIKTAIELYLETKEGRTLRVEIEPVGTLASVEQ